MYVLCYRVRSGSCINQDGDIHMSILSFFAPAFDLLHSCPYQHLSLLGV